MKTLRYAIALIILIVLFIFSVYNAQPVRLSFFDHQSPQLPLFLVLLFSFFLGLLLAGLFNAMKVAQLRRQIGQLQKTVETGRRQPAGGLDRAAAPGGSSPAGAGDLQGP